jgi:excisionase family DNA binding protein
MRYLTTTEAAVLLHLDPSRVRLLCQRGRINTIKIGNTYGIPKRELERFAATPRRAGRPRRGKPASWQDSAAVPFEHNVLSSQ